LTKRLGQFDATGFDVPVNPPTIIEVLEHGTEQEIREVLLGIGLALEHGSPLGATTAAWLGQALQKIGGGLSVNDPSGDGQGVQKRVSADAVLGLTNKRKHGVYEARAVEHMITSAKGVTRAEATQFVALYDPVTNTLRDDPEDRAGERLKKRRRRQGTK
jgi:hypothetical protein